MFEPLTCIFLAWFLMAVVLVRLWFSQKACQAMSIVNVAWSVELAILALFYAGNVDGYISRQRLLGMMT